MPLVRKDPDARPPVAGPDAPDVLARLASGTDEERWASARAAADVPGGVQALGAALSREADRRVREAIFTSLARLGSRESVDAVLPHLRSDDANLRVGALDALRAMPEAVGARVPVLLADPDPDVRVLACELARGLHSSAATRALCDRLGSEPEANVCAAAVEVLAEIGGPEALPELVRCADRFRSDPFLSFAIKIAAERIGSQSPERRG
jgi:HEAT repeat protein